MSSGPGNSGHGGSPPPGESAAQRRERKGKFPARAIIIDDSESDADDSLTKWEANILKDFYPKFPSLRKVHLREIMRGADWDVDIAQEEANSVAVSQFHNRVPGHTREVAAQALEQAGGNSDRAREILEGALSEEDVVKIIDLMAVMRKSREEVERMYRLAGRDADRAAEALYIGSLPPPPPPPPPPPSSGSEGELTYQEKVTEFMDITKASDKEAHLQLDKFRGDLDRAAEDWYANVAPVRESLAGRGNETIELLNLLLLSKVDLKVHLELALQRLIFYDFDVNITKAAVLRILRPPKASNDSDDGEGFMNDGFTNDGFDGDNEDEDENKDEDEHENKEEKTDEDEDEDEDGEDKAEEDEEDKGDEDNNDETSQADPMDDKEDDTQPAELSGVADNMGIDNIDVYTSTKRAAEEDPDQPSAKRPRENDDRLQVRIENKFYHQKVVRDTLRKIPFVRDILTDETRVIELREIKTEGFTLVLKFVTAKAIKLDEEKYPGPEHKLDALILLIETCLCLRVPTSQVISSMEQLLIKTRDVLKGRHVQYAYGFKNKFSKSKLAEDKVQGPRNPSTHTARTATLEQLQDLFVKSATKCYMEHRNDPYAIDNGPVYDSDDENIDVARQDAFRGGFRFNREMKHIPEFKLNLLESFDQVWRGREWRKGKTTANRYFLDPLTLDRFECD